VNVLIEEMPKKSNREILKELAPEINKYHRVVEESLQTSLEYAIRAGILLIRAKFHARHGNWIVWVNASCDFGLRTAQFYMQLATHRKELNAKSISHLTVSDAVKLLQQSNKSNKNHNNKDPLPKDTGKLVAAFSKSCLETKHLIERIDEKEGKEFWAKDDPTVARSAKRAENLMEALSEYFGKRK